MVSKSLKAALSLRSLLTITYFEPAVKPLSPSPDILVRWKQQSHLQGLLILNSSHQGEFMMVYLCCCRSPKCCYSHCP